MGLEDELAKSLDKYFTSPDEAREIATDVHENSDDTADLPTSFVGAGDTIQEAHDSLGDSWTDSGRVIVLPGYDPTDEDYPIVWSKRASLYGGNYTNLRPGSGEYAIVVNIEDAPGNRPPGPHFYEFSVTGGGGGCKVEACRYSVWHNIDVNNVEEDAYHVRGRDWGETAVNTHHFYSCFQDRAGRDGFHIGMRAHGTQLVGCHSYFAGRHGIRIDEATNCKMFGGSSELSQEEALMLDSSHVFLAKSAYFEGSNPDSGGGAEVHVTNGASTISIEDCYFNGFGKADWGIRFYDCINASIEGCEAWNYDRGFIYVDRAATVDVNRSSHCIRDDTQLLGRDDDAVDIRDDGVLIPQDLSQREGEYPGDKGYHLTDDGDIYKAVWFNGEWHRHPGTTTV